MQGDGETIAENYILADTIGRGGMGVVYRARHVGTGRTVAVKRIRRELEGDAYVRERFLHEAIAAARISHPGVVRILEYGYTNGERPYIVMGHVLGRPLGRMLRARGELSTSQITTIMSQLLGALAATHARGVVHADVKADNLLVDADDSTTLIDYGLARIDDCAREADRRTVVSGTLEYLAPERLYGAPPTIASDVFGAGVILYELLTGLRPFRGTTANQLLDSHLAGAPVRPSLVHPRDDASSALDHIVGRALDVDPRTRLSSAGLFQAALEASGGAANAHLDGPAHASVAAAIRHGDADGVIVAYLELAAMLVAESRFADAAAELEQAVTLVTGGAGVSTLHAPAALWRLLLLLAGVQDGAGRRSRARFYAQHALAHARLARSSAGEARCQQLLRRVLDTRSAPQR